MSAQATSREVMEFFSTPGKPCKVAEYSALDKADRDELRTLVGQHLSTVTDSATGDAS